MILWERMKNRISSYDLLEVTEELHRCFMPWYYSEVASEWPVNSFTMGELTGQFSRTPDYSNFMEELDDG